MHDRKKNSRRGPKRQIFLVGLDLLPLFKFIILVTASLTASFGFWSVCSVGYLSINQYCVTEQFNICDYSRHTFPISGNNS
jgi:hypothetical protein